MMAETCKGPTSKGTRCALPFNHAGPCSDGVVSLTDLPAEPSGCTFRTGRRSGKRAALMCNIANGFSRTVLTKEAAELGITYSGAAAGPGVVEITVGGLAEPLRVPFNAGDTAATVNAAIRAALQSLEVPVHRVSGRKLEKGAKPNSNGGPITMAPNQPWPPAGDPVEDLEEARRMIEHAARDPHIPAILEAERARRAELAEVSRLLDAGEVLTECETCEACGLTWKRSRAHYAKCPRCYPAQVALIEILTNRNAWPGHEWIWDHCLGPRGRWRLLEDVVCVPIEDIRALAEELPGIAPDERTMPGAVREVRRLKVLAAEVSEDTRDRANTFETKHSEACDRLGRVIAELHDKRAECDRLRDELEDLKRRGSR